MGKRFWWLIVFSTILCAAELRGQDSSGVGSFFGRFSFAVSGSYHYAPWKDFNNSLAALESDIEFDPSFKGTSGTYKQVLGDGAAHTMVLFELMHGIDLGVSGSLLESAASSHLTDYFEPNLSGAMNESLLFRLRCYSVGVVARYRLALSEAVSAFAEVSAEREFGRLHFEYEGENSWNSFAGSADMTNNIWAGVISVGAKLRLFGPVSIISNFEYRLMKFNEFSGAGNYLMKMRGTFAMTLDSLVSPVRLVESDPFFGVHYIYAKGPYSSPYVPYHHTDYYDQIPGVEAPAILNLSGFGLNLGVEYEF